MTVGRNVRTTTRSRPRWAIEAAGRVRMVRALVTGGGGFVGRHLGTHLGSMGDEVISIDLEVDVADPEAITAAVLDAQPDAIYHLVALSHVGESWESPAEVLRVNVLGTAALLAAGRALDEPPVVLVVSSAEAYGAVGPDDLPITESTPLRPISPYAASKAAAEQLALQAWRGYGQPVVLVRPFNHVGPGQAPTFAVSGCWPSGSWKPSATVRAGSPPARSPPVATTPTSATSCAPTGSSSPAGRRGTPTTSARASTWRCPRWPSDCARLAGAEVELVTDPDLVRPVDLPVLRGDPGHLAADTGWRPEIAFDDTLLDILEFWRQRLAA